MPPVRSLPAGFGAGFGGGAAVVAGAVVVVAVVVVVVAAVVVGCVVTSVVVGVVTVAVVSLVVVSGSGDPAWIAPATVPAAKTQTISATTPARPRIAALKHALGAAEPLDRSDPRERGGREPASPQRFVYGNSSPWTPTSNAITFGDA